MNPTNHHHEDPAHHRDLTVHCCCCRARWISEGESPDEALVMHHAEGCPYIIERERIAP